MVPVRSDEIRHLAQQIDYDAGGTLIYYGYAPAGTATSKALWRIARETLDANGRSISIDFPQGSADFSFQWSLHTSYTYA